MAETDIIVPLQPADALPVVRTIGIADIRSALQSGWDDFRATPTQVVFLCLVYPVIGLVLGQLIFGYDLVPLFYPVIAGFALLGPFAAIGLYELSRRRELGLDTSWKHAFDVVHSPSLAAIIAVGGLLFVIFGFWLVMADTVYTTSFGDRPPVTLTELIRDVFMTSEGWRLLVIGNLVGFLFAVLAMSISVVSFPLLLDRNVGAAVAIATSIKAVAKNPVPMALWGLIVAVALALGSLPAFVGLAIVVPVLGHATWHLYRKVVEPDLRPRPEYHPREKVERYAAEFPSVLITLFSRGKRQ